MGRPFDGSSLSVAPEPYDSEGPRWVVARAEDELVARPPLGGVGFRRVAEGVGGVRRLWVDPSWRGLGVGRTLMAGLEGAALELGFENLVQDSGDRQPEAVQLYRAAGWTRLYVDPAGKPQAAGIRFA